MLCAMFDLFASITHSHTDKNSFNKSCNLDHMCSKQSNKTTVEIMRNQIRYKGDKDTAKGVA